MYRYFLVFDFVQRRLDHCRGLSHQGRRREMSWLAAGPASSWPLLSMPALEVVCLRSSTNKSLSVHFKGRKKMLDVTDMHKHTSYTLYMHIYTCGFGPHSFDLVQIPNAHWKITWPHRPQWKDFLATFGRLYESQEGHLHLLRSPNTSWGVANKGTSLMHFCCFIRDV